MQKNIRQISQEQFDNFNVAKSPISFIATEKEWFSSDNDKILGLILKDNIDKDWSYVILGLDETDTYRAIDVKVSEESLDNIRSILYRKMGSLTIEDGKAKEDLFESSDKEVDESKKLIITDISDEFKKYFKKHPEKLYDLHPRKFEELIASILEDLGFDVELTKATRDGGTDIIASIKNKLWDILAYVECKRHSPENKVGVGIVRKVVGVHALRKPAKSMIVTTSFFTKNSQEEAKIMENDLDLRDYENIKEWLNEY